MNYSEEQKKAFILKLIAKNLNVNGTAIETQQTIDNAVEKANEVFKSLQSISEETWINDYEPTPPAEQDDNVAG